MPGNLNTAHLIQSRRSAHITPTSQKERKKRTKVALVAKLNGNIELGWLREN
jgi:hypothetical protein